jgi:hypothetical protein
MRRDVRRHNTCRSIGLLVQGPRMGIPTSISEWLHFVIDGNYSLVDPVNPGLKGWLEDFHRAFHSIQHHQHITSHHTSHITSALQVPRVCDPNLKSMLCHGSIPEIPTLALSTLQLENSQLPTRPRHHTAWGASSASQHQHRSLAGANIPAFSRRRRNGNPTTTQRQPNQPLALFGIRQGRRS